MFIITVFGYTALMNSRRSHIFGPSLLIFTNICYVFSHSLAKHLSTLLPVSEIMWARFAFGPLILLPLAFLGILPFKIQRWKMMSARTFFGISAMFLYFLALKYGDAGKASLLFHASSLWTFIIAKQWFNENPSIQTKYLIPISFIGLWLVLRPSHIFDITLSDGFALIASILNAGVNLTLKDLRNDHDSASILLANYGISTLVLTAVALPNVVIPTGDTGWILIAMGFIGFIGNFAMTIGFKYTLASVSSNLMLLLVPLMYLSGVVFFNETLDILSMCGVGIVLACLGAIAWYQ